MICISVPATSANLGPGFDCLGIALSIRARFCFSSAVRGVSITGCAPAYCNENNLVYTSMKETWKHLNLDEMGVNIHIESDIPSSRGLGSSAAFIVAGVTAALLLHRIPLSDKTIFQIATLIEGHPDNVAPAVFGGMRISLLEGQHIVSQPSDIHTTVRFAALIPKFELSTRCARGALPEYVRHTVAASNAAHLAMLLKALEKGDPKLIQLALQDQLHEPYRFPLIENGRLVQSLAREAGAVSCFISGAGPTLMCIYQEDDFCTKIRTHLETVSNTWRCIPLEIENRGYIVSDI